MSSKSRQILSIAETASIDHAAGHPQPAAPFTGAKECAAVRRAVARGWLTITQASRGEVWAQITASGLGELARLRGDVPGVTTAGVGSESGDGMQD